MKKKLKIVSGDKVVDEILAIKDDDIDDLEGYLEQHQVANQKYYVLSISIAEIRKDDEDLDSFLKADLSSVPLLKEGLPPIVLGHIERGGPMFDAAVYGWERIAGAVKSGHTHILSYVPITGTAFTLDLKKRIKKGEIVPQYNTDKKDKKANKKTR